MLIQRSNKMVEELFVYREQPDFHFDFFLWLWIVYIKYFYSGTIRINSTGRTPEHNSAVGGADNSYHLILTEQQAKQMGVQWRPVKAADIQPDNMDKFIDFLRANKAQLRLLGIRGFGFYERFVHFDTRPKRTVFLGSEPLKNEFEKI